MILTTFILFWVRVPVLSVAIIFMEPNVSQAESFLTTDFLRASLFTPNDNTIVTIAGSPSGIAATAREMEIS